MLSVINDYFEPSLICKCFGKDFSQCSNLVSNEFHPLIPCAPSSPPYVSECFIIAWRSMSITLYGFADYNAKRVQERGLHEWPIIKKLSFSK